MAKTEGTRKLDAVIAELDPKRRAVAKALRATIRREAPDLAEDVKWNAPVWSRRKMIFCLQVYDDFVHLGVMRGAEIAKDHPAIVGTGAAMRHVEVPTPSDADTPELRAIVRAAIALDATPPPKRTVRASAN